ncbi:unnamed protein product [Miscanthus lutarioriparius]|uniref:Uncharacterized protein n=1 Tax=Miscanthus lutarioriparius TaxID=422564 RepID=A0A811QF83_9POAL|nr:unnamed protein product [Miscanthus lutarioriparius]
MQHLVDFAGRKSAHNLILRDMLMLENQVPLFLLCRILEPQCEYPGEAGELLPWMVTELMKELCPFKMVDTFPAIEVARRTHTAERRRYDNEEQPVDGAGDEEQKHAAGLRVCEAPLLTMSSMASGLNSGPMRYVMRPIAFIVKAPWKMLTVVRGFLAMKQPVEAFFMSKDRRERRKPHDPNGVES